MAGMWRSKMKKTRRIRGEDDGENEVEEEEKGRG